ncbi:hypothetical protein CRYUN_Cryun37aG0134200 [Craigia yunnanensis]
MEDYLLLFNTPAPASSSLLKEFLSNNIIFKKGNNGDSSTFCLLNKASIIHSIRERTANRSVPEGILDSLQIIEELDRKQGLPVSDSMRAAFCAVAVHCTLTSLPLSWPSYFDAVQRIWRLRIQNLEDSGTSQLLGPGLAKWRDDVEAALWDSETSQRLLRINTHDEAMHSVRVYLREASSSMKPAFLRLALSSTARPTVDPVAPAQAPPSPHICTDKVASTAGPTVDSVAPAQAPPSPHRCTDKVASTAGPTVDPVAPAQAPPSLRRCTDKGKRILRMNSQTRCKLGSFHRHYKGPVIIAASEEDQPSCSKYGSLSTPEVKKLQDALKSSTADLLAAVTDPLPEALEVAERVASYMAGKNLHAQAILNKDKGVPSTSFNPTRKPDQAEGNQASLNQNNVLRPSLMERNGTARTFEVSI